MKKKKIIPLIVLLVFVVFLTGCSKEESYICLPNGWYYVGNR